MANIFDQIYIWKISRLFETILSILQSWSYLKFLFAKITMAIFVPSTLWMCMN